MNYHCGYNIDHLIELVMCQFYSLENCLPPLLFLVPVFSVLFGRKSHLRNGDLCFKGGAYMQAIWNSAWETCILHHLFIHSIVYIGVNSQVHNLYCDLQCSFTLYILLLKFFSALAIEESFS